LGEKKKAMDPGSVIYGRKYKKVSKKYENTLTSSVIAREEPAPQTLPCRREFLSKPLGKGGRTDQECPPR
jgi:hypothetical protein